MKAAVAVVFACLVMAASAAFIPVLSRTEHRDDSGQFSLSYTSGDGTTFSEQGVLAPTADGKDYVLVKNGAYSYTSPEGIPVAVKYTADTNGFHPESASIPVAPH
ncbi:endocuticle structural glycoprotein SgAbd-8 isoform X2 [Anabrus simplex]|uniref:endocuticle structural glycoprotein SgAbd-8 isoform X2 n=1 Tax=Anabrus simplex TaxID=316456 RepID=UPI0035A3C277